MSVLTVGSHALPALHTKGAHWWSAIVRYFTADAAVVSADTGGLYIPKRVPPKNYEYLENSAMRRAMERL
ncbi:MAG: hypothetical protein QOE04_496 [Mycobacterium sp.]|jgi:glucokinase|nr:hypothetical protein [Mycobacterium sp.]MDT5386855.1 hypothetical protein [Mycobacterium sp.]MDT5398771.1 hypothetical protein [Mycobacterium sp.]MDT7758008.1 hypothetical protein [Mycobacterium sp.]